MSDSIRVLHVDDEPDFADLTATFLERENERLTVETETDARDAVERLGDDVDCIVSDYEMPGTSGIEFLEGVRETHPDLPFILFTGKGSEEIASEAIPADVTDYLQKESGTEQYAVLANRIENAVRKYRAERLVNRTFKAMDTTREGIALLGEDGEFMYVNDAYGDIVGSDPEELIGEFWEHVSPDNQVDRIYEEILPSVPETGYWRAIRSTDGRTGAESWSTTRSRTPRRGR